jgi:hypothetical protein
LLQRNNGDGTFSDVSAAAGLAALPPASRRGAAFGDVLNDGRMDIAILNSGEPPTLLMNHAGAGNHRVMFQLVGTRSNAAAIGARVTVHIGKAVQIGEVRGGGSYLSQNDLRLHFGLGPAQKIDSVEVRWPSGRVGNFQDVAAGNWYTIKEGKGIISTKPLRP